MSLRLKDLPPKYREKVSKYNNHKTVVDGIEFDSASESERYAELKILERAKVIKNLELQPRFLLQKGFSYKGHKERKIEYVADFQYEQDGKIIVEDVKGDKTDVYKLKRKLFLYKYGDKVDFNEVFNE